MYAVVLSSLAITMHLVCRNHCIRTVTTGSLIFTITSKSARALHGEKEILKRFSKSSVLTLLFFTVVDCGHGYIAIWKLLCEKPTAEVRPARTIHPNHMKKTILTRVPSPSYGPTNSRENFVSAPRLAPMCSVPLFAGMVQPLFLFPGSTFPCPISLQLYPSSCLGQLFAWPTIPLL
jgi:hypothetical protein